MRRFYHVVLAVVLGLVVALGVRAAFAQEAPAASVSPALAPSASASAKATRAVPTDVRVREKTVFTIRAARGGRSAGDRAKTANTSIEALLAHPDELGEARFEETQPGTAVIYVGKTPVLTLGQEDVDASGEVSLGVLAAQVTTRLSDAIA
ncbi:MAG TPA: hypothetical protein VIF62_06475, partial [Labilithrix sp.]